MKTLILFLCLGLIFAGCKKNRVQPPDQTYQQSQGVLVGYNARMCPEPSCGGMIVTIKNDTAKNAPPYYLINATLPQLGISDTTKFPINVDLSWKRDTGAWRSFNYIIVSHITVIK